VNTALKYWVVTIALIVWWVLAWLAGPWLNLHGNDLWLFRGALLLIGLAAYITSVWWFRGLDEDSTEQMAAEGTAGSDEIDILMRKGQARLRAIQAGKPALGNLPAVLVLGETGSAKTSIVLQCGLEPQLLAGHTVQNNIPIPTRALNLWYAPPFIVAEAGGPLLHEPPRWAHLVKKFAPSGTQMLLGKDAVPPRLALVCIDSEKFLTIGVAETLGESIDQWRARLRETSQLLGINLPVYVLFTRADRLQFFQDYVAPLSNDEASRVFGAALPMAAYTGSAYAKQETAAVSAAFDNLFYALADRRLALLSRKPDSAPAPPIYEFPREFRKLRSILVPLLVDICRPGPSLTTPILRGFYFTGVRPLLVSAPRPTPAQEEPLAEDAAELGDLRATRMLDIKKAKAAALKLLGAPEAVETRRIPQWVFLPQLFKEVLFQDTTALTTSTFSTKTGQRKKFLLAAAMGILLVLIVGFTVSSIRNKRLENQVIAAARDISDVHLTGHQLPSLDALNKLETLRQSVETLANNQRVGPPPSMRWGLYVGGSLLPELRRIYFQHFQELLFQQAQAALRQTLSALPASPGPNDRYDPVFDALKAYLLTTSDFARSNREFLSPILLRAWVADRDINPARLQVAQKQFDFYADELKTGNPFPSENDAEAIARARHYLAQFSGAQRVYGVILAEAEKANPAIDFNRNFPGAAEVVADQANVSGAFTKSGWTFIQGVLENPAPYFSAESWVLAEENLSPADLTKRADDLRHVYQRDYVARWRSFLRGATVSHPVNLGRASQELQKLAGDQSPLLALFCVAAHNTSVDQPDVAKAFQAVQSVTPHDCQDQYVGPSSAAYIKGLSDLQACVDRTDNTPSNQKDSAKAQCMSNVTAAEQATKKIIEGFQPDPDAHADQTVGDLLLAPINMVATLLRPGPVSAAGLCQQMSTLESQFPFHSPASKEVSAQELASVFAPTKGALSQFYTSALKNLLLPQGTGYAPNPASGQKVNPPFLRFFNRAIGVQRALYPAAGEPLQFRYALRPRSTENVSSLDLTIDGQVLSFSGGAAQFTPLSWPGTSAQGVRLAVKIPGGAPLGFPSYDGMWGVFHFFADATVLQRNGNISTLEWVLGGDRPVTAPNGKPVTVQFDLDTHGAPPILEKGFLSNLRCVPVVAR
jgi:type VI secretion system protein ImpL